MTLTSILRLLWRHPLAVVPAFIIALTACVAVVLVAPPTYRASGAVILLNPPALPEVTAQNPTIPEEYQNPYTRFGDVSVVVDVLVRILTGERADGALEAAGLEGDVEIAANRDFYRGPIVDIAVESSTPEAAIAGTELVVSELRRELDALQLRQGTDETYRIRAEGIVGPTEATTVFTPTLRLLLVVMAGGVALIFAAAVAADRLERRRRRLSATPRQGVDETMSRHDSPGLSDPAALPGDRVSA